MSDAPARLAQVLDEMAAALAAPDADALLAVEERLTAVLAELASMPAIAAGERPHLAESVAQARTALARCQVLGAALNDAARLSLDAQGLASQYERSGGHVPAPTSRGHRLHARL